MITQCLTNGVVILQFCAIQITYNISYINPYKSDTKVEDINPEHFFYDVNI